MANDLTDPNGNLQVDPSGVTPSGEEGKSTNGESQDIQPREDGNVDDKIGPDNLNPELEEQRKQLLKDYHAKLRHTREDKLRFERDMEVLKGQSQTLNQLLQQEWFKKAAETERARRNGQVEDIDLTDEQFETIKNDKDAFKKFVVGMAKNMVGQVEPKLSEAQNSLKSLQTEREFDRVDAKYKGELSKLNDEGLLQPYLEQGFGYEAAFKQYKFDTDYQTLKSDLDKRAQEKATELLRDTREGAIAKGGAPVPKGRQILKAKSFEDAFSAAWDAEVRGVKDYVVQK